MKLISITDFVLEQQNPETNISDSFRKTLSRIYQYAEFLKQPLTLGMFVPCDENGNVLTEPKMKVVKIGFEEEDVSWDIDEVEIYRAAKEKVLFKDFRLVKKLNDYCGCEFYRFEQNDEILNINFSHYTSIEKLIDLQNILLTESAIKQIGLNPKIKTKMKQIELELKKRLLIVELTENKLFSEEKQLHALIDSDKWLHELLGKKRDLKLICKGSELTEEILKELVEIKPYGSPPYFCTLDYTRKGKNKDGFNPGFCAPNGNQFITSFISAIEAQGYYWGENPIQSSEPNADLSFYDTVDDYKKALKKWRLGETKTFNPEKTLIFEILL